MFTWVLQIEIRGGFLTRLIHRPCFPHLAPATAGKTRCFPDIRDDRQRKTVSFGYNGVIHRDNQSLV